MMKRSALFSALCATLLASSAFAAKSEPGARCKPTERRGNLSFYPGEGNVPTSNNLRRKAGSGMVANGIPLLVEGKVLDQNCVPVYGAVVELWQPNATGYYQTKSRSSNADPYFAGSGRALTDNTGTYRFITVLPGVSGKSSPKLHFRVHHTHFSDLVTEVTVGADAPTARASGIYAFPRAVNPDNPNEGQQLIVDIVLKGSQPYRTY